VRGGKVKGKMELEKFQQAVRKALLDAMDKNKYTPQVTAVDKHQDKRSL
jgi:hypothetical protein